MAALELASVAQGDGGVKEHRRSQWNRRGRFPPEPEANTAQPEADPPGDRAPP